MRRLFGCLLAAGMLSGVFAQEKPTLAFRTDGGDEKLPWYQIQPAVFPPENSAHYIAGELIGLDHINRTGTLRPDRRNDQRTDDYDRPMPFTLLPYGSMRYHGAPAELRDIPIGTHLHGLFYFEPKAGKDGKGVFTQAFRLEDDVSHCQRTSRSWRIESLQLDKGTLTVIGLNGAEKKPDEKPTIFKLGPATRIWRGACIAKGADLVPGQEVLINITLATLKGPGRCTDIWLDTESREMAALQQVEVHRLYQRTHGLAGWVDTVDDGRNLVTVTLFDGFDPTLLSSFKKGDHVFPAVAEESLRTYDQVNDALGAEIVQVNSVPVAPGCSGVQVVFKPEIMLEGFRPKRIVRVIPGGFRDDLPYEERLYK